MNDAVFYKQLFNLFNKNSYPDILILSDVDELLSNIEFTKIIEDSNFIFSGPGSPSYAAKNWIETDVPNIFEEKLLNGSSLVFASAAASTLGIRTIPVYEIYKVGIDPYWESGINLLQVFDINCVVVPHFNNKEGGNHDTSMSYLGENRMKKLQQIHPTNILGIDEHTALILSLIHI